MSIEIAPRIVVDPAIRIGKPVIQGTRVPVQVIVSKMASGLTSEVVADEYGITLNDIQAALAYAFSSISLLADSRR